MPSAAMIADCIYLVKEVATSLKEKNNREMEVDASLESLPHSQQFPDFPMPCRIRSSWSKHPVRYYALPGNSCGPMLLQVSMLPRRSQQASARLVADAYLHPRVDDKMQQLEYLPHILRSLVDLAVFHVKRARINWTDQALIRIGREDLCHGYL